MTKRLSISLPDDLAEKVERIAASSHVSMAATVRSILADVVPRMTSVLDYIGTAPTISRTEVAEAEVWLKDLHALYERAPETFRDALGDVFPLDAPVETLENLDHD